MRTVNFSLALVLLLSWGAAGMASEKGEHAHGMATGEGRACCDSPMPNVRGAYKHVSSEELKVMLDSKAHDDLLQDLVSRI